MYFLDSNIVIDFLHGRLPLGLDWLKSTDARLVKIPAVVEMELLVGAHKSANPEKTLRAVESFVCNYEVVPFDSASARIAARLRADLEAAGQKIGPNDLGQSCISLLLAA